MTAADTMAERVRESRTVRGLARLGLMSRGVLYLLLAYLAAALAAGWGLDGKQVNGNGALREVAGTPFGLVALCGAAVGFAAFAVARIAGAYADRSVSRLRRVSTLGQAVVYLGMAWLTASFVLGRRSTGSEQQQESTTARLLMHPAGRLIVLGIGVVVLGVCAWQIWIGIRGGFADSLRTVEMGRRMRQVVRWISPIGIVARAAALAPLGALLIFAAVRSEPSRAQGLDHALMALTRAPGGRAVVWVIAAGFFAFACYSFLESHYREVHAGD